MPDPALSVVPDPAERDAHPIVERVREALAADLRGDRNPTSAQARKEVAALLGKSWAYVPGSILAEIPACDVAAMVDRLVTDCSEIDVDEHHAALVDIVWRVKAATASGMTILGTCKPVGKRERQTWRGDTPAPFWRITLALDIWILLTERERWALVFHELLHATYKGEGSATPAGRGHDVEEFAAVIARYGIRHGMHAAVVAQAMARPDIVEELRVWSIDPVSKNGLLFGADLRPVGWHE